MTLTEYIKTHYREHPADFAKDQGVDRQTVNRWKKQGYLVVDGWLLSRRRPINTRQTSSDVTEVLQ